MGRQEGELGVSYVCTQQLQMLIGQQSGVVTGATPAAYIPPFGSPVVPQPFMRSKGGTRRVGDCRMTETDPSPSAGKALAQSEHKD